MLLTGCIPLLVWVVCISNIQCMPKKTHQPMSQSNAGTHASTMGDGMVSTNKIEGSKDHGSMDMSGKRKIMYQGPMGHGSMDMSGKTKTMYQGSTDHGSMDMSGKTKTMYQGSTDHGSMDMSGKTKTMYQGSTDHGSMDMSGKTKTMNQGSVIMGDPFDSMSTGTKGPGMGRGCFYKGKYYTGTWNDECKFTCTCNNPITGQYNCQQRCPTYPQLPAGCSWKLSETDKCCKIPSCPGMAGYKPQAGQTFMSTGVKPSTMDQSTQTVGGKHSTMDQGFVTTGGKHSTMDKSFKTTGGETGDMQGETMTSGMIPTGQMPNKMGLVTKCMYNNKGYNQDATWFDGCKYKCRCINARNGLYRCTSRCVEYPKILAKGCDLRLKPGQECCYDLYCNNKLVQTTSQPNLDAMLTSGSGANTAPFMSINMNVAPTGSMGGKPTGCGYKGLTYIQSQKWTDGCDFVCECVNAAEGKYKCSSRCPTYSTLPAGCKLEPSPEDPCCRKPVCNGMTGFGIPGQIGTGSKSMTGSTDGMNVGSFLGSNQDITTMTKGRSSGFITPGKSTRNMFMKASGKCEYNGKQYSQGMEWNDKCDYTCVCEDAMTGRYKCSSRCKTYEPLQGNCKLVPSKTDICCKDVMCNGQIMSGKGPNGMTISGAIDNIGTLTSDTITQMLANMQPGGLIPTTDTTGPGAGTMQPKAGYCMYKKQYYSEGQEWADGCDYDCKCVSGRMGYYRCTSRCPTYRNLPPNCKLVTVEGKCCQTVDCSAITLPGGQCRYKNRGYGQNDVWNDGCSFTCKCVNARRGEYHCVSKCPQYGALSPGCKMVPSKGDPCCSEPECPGYSIAFTKNEMTNMQFRTDVDQISIPKTPNQPISGTGHVPYDTMPYPADYKPVGTYPTGIKPGGTYPAGTKQDGTNQAGTKPDISYPTGSKPGGSTPGEFLPSENGGLMPQKAGYCMYKKQYYSEGQEWADGCDYDCKCVSGRRGYYRCTSRCPTYTNLPPSCKLVTNPDKCCQTPDCSAITLPDYPSGKCSYKNRDYGQNEVWNDGCKYTCKCVNARRGEYYCVSKCPKYGALSPGCKMVPSVDDPCCSEPKCSGYSIAFTKNEITNMQFRTDVDQISIPKTPYQLKSGAGHVPDSSMSGGSLPGGSMYPGTKPDDSMPSGSNPDGSMSKDTKPGQYLPSENGGIKPPQGGYCMYNNQFYTEKETWTDGCKYTCECVNGQMGYYRCYSRCLTYSKLPPGCVMVNKPGDTCCQEPDCSALIPKGNYCQYNTQRYYQGETWTDGCMDCSCMNAQRGEYRCRSRCTQYGTLPTGCTFVTNPGDACNCKVPDCFGYSLALTPQETDTLYFGPGANVPAIPSTGTIPVIMTPGSDTGMKPGSQQPVYIPNISNSGMKPGSQTPGYIPDSGMKPGSQTPGYTPDSGMKPGSQTPGYTPGSGMKPGSQTPGYIPDSGMKPGSQTPGYTPDSGMKPGSQTPGYIPDSGMKPGSQTPGYIPDSGMKPGSQTPGYTPDSGIKPGSQTPGYTPDSGMKPGSQTPGYTPDSGMKPGSQTPGYTPDSGMKPGSQTPGYILDSGMKPGSQQTHNMPSIRPGTPPVDVATAIDDIMNAGTSGKRCMYKQKAYGTGEVWYDGCDICMCLDANGKYECSPPSCPRSLSLSTGPECRHQPIPGNECCKEVICDKPGTKPVKPTMPTKPEPVTPRVPVCQQPKEIGPCRGAIPKFFYNSATSACEQFLYGGCQGNNNNFDTHAVCEQHCVRRTEPPYCRFNGQQFSQDETWFDGCKKACTCKNANSGFIQCIDRCPTYEKIPAGCVLVTPPVTPPGEPCCQQVSCGGVLYNPAAFKPMGGQGPKQPTSDTQSLGPIQKDTGCTYNGKQYRTGELWDDGCTYRCQCVNGYIGHYKCTSRCSMYDALPNGCRMVSDPKDACCRIPKCANWIAYTPTQKPGETLELSVENLHTIQTTATTMTGGGAPGTGCQYDGQTYKKGQTWDDGCLYKCECFDMNGNYGCEDRCKFNYDKTEIPPYGCRLVKSTRDSCCEEPSCDVGYSWTPKLIVKGSPTDGTLPHKPTQPQQGCMVKGTKYTKGQSWTDECNNICKCVDMNGNYACDNSAGCAMYDLPNECWMAPSKKNPCCQEPVCQDGYQYTPTPIGKDPMPPSGSGSVLPSNPDIPIDGPGPKMAQGCSYFGKNYNIGQKWDDGCLVTCRCIGRGSFECQLRCARYNTQMVATAGCRMSKPAGEICCESPECPSYIINRPQPLPQVQTTYDPYGKCSKGAGYLATWNEGCTLTCECIRIGASSNMFYIPICKPRCKQYNNNLPFGCKMVQDKEDACCKVPECNIGISYQPTIMYDEMPATFYTPQTPTVKTPPVEIDPIQTISYIPTQPGCMYKGTKYTKGDVWIDECNNNCNCVDMNGNYNCDKNAGCAVYDLPNECWMAPSPTNKCCQEPVCQEGYPYKPTPIGKDPMPPSGGGVLPPKPYTPQTGPELKPDVPPKDDMTPTNQKPHTSTQPGCMYKGTKYTKGEVWIDDCNNNCNCVDMNGNYNCDENAGCAVYDLPNECWMAPSPTNKCCQEPVCQEGYPYKPTPIGKDPMPPSGGGVLPPKPYTPQTGPELKPDVPPKDDMTPTNQKPHTSTQPGCMYKGTKYTKGEVWIDDCNNNCNCVDMNGNYNCDENAGCAVYDLPNECWMAPSPTNKCCQEPVCQEGYPYKPTPIGKDPMPPSGGGVLPPKPYTPQTGPELKPDVPPKDDMTPTNQKPHTSTQPGCMYKGTKYTKGEVWIDDCNNNCNCVDMNGNYNCDENAGCAVYNLPNECWMAPSKTNPCCQEPVCQEGYPYIPTPIGKDPVPSIGDGVLPSKQMEHKQPIDGPGTKMASGCSYFGTNYNIGQTWADGCLVTCICNGKGSFMCRPRCQMYNTEMVASVGCRMIKRARDKCCEYPECPSYVINKPQPLPQVPTTYDPNGKCSKGAGYLATWNEGCSLTCECITIGDSPNMFSIPICKPRCQKYNTNLPFGCKMVFSKTDKCCTVPECNNGISYKPTIMDGEMTATFYKPEPQIVKTPPVMIDPILTIQNPGPKPTDQSKPSKPPTDQQQEPYVPQPKPYPPTQPGCMFKGTKYTKGEVWIDDCNNNCNCVDMNGNYNCDNIAGCAVYDLPNECWMAPSKTNLCCQEPVCREGYQYIPTPIGKDPVPPIGGGELPMEPKQPIDGQGPKMASGCSYFGTNYDIGQTWDDGCLVTCTCYSGREIYFTCMPRCPMYNTEMVATAGCRMRKPVGEKCCESPECPAYVFNKPQPLPQVQTTYDPYGKCSQGPGYVATWNEGCSLTCMCIRVGESSNMFYIPICKPRCPKYETNMPAGCNMVNSPTDKCCKVPDCQFGISYKPTIVYGGLPATFYKPQQPIKILPVQKITKPNIQGVETKPAELPYTPPKSPQHKPYTPPTGDQSYVYIPPMSTGPEPYTPPKSETPNLYVPAKGNGCDYFGTQYKKGDKWVGRCNADCKCVDDNGNYICHENCPEYDLTDMPSHCWMQYPAGEKCCRKPLCVQGVHYTPVLRIRGVSTGNTGQTSGKPTYPPKPKPYVPVSVFVIPPSKPDIIPTSKPSTYLPRAGSCLYNNKYYTQGQQWQVGCDYTCDCVNGQEGYYRCVNRCPIYGPLPYGCNLVKRPGECCQEVDCSALQPTGGQCVYNNVRYNQDATWTIGCDYVCRCTDSVSGEFICVSRCPRYGLLPAYCKMAPQANDACCPVPVCRGYSLSFTVEERNRVHFGSMPPSKTGVKPSIGDPGIASDGTLMPDPNIPTKKDFFAAVSKFDKIVNQETSPDIGSGLIPTDTEKFTTGTIPVNTENGTMKGPIGGYCLYKNNYYTQGQHWEDGCDYSCDCVSAQRGYYRCLSRCPTYARLPQGCKMVAVKGECCEKVDCGAIVTPGGGQCVYNNRRYNNGQTWNDGCDKCECTNAYIGEYKCSSRCPVYGVMPAGCKMVTDVYDACCKVPDCAGYSLGYTPEERVRMKSGQKPGKPTSPTTGLIPSLPGTGMGTRTTGKKPGPDIMIYRDPEQPTGPGPVPTGSPAGAGGVTRKYGHCLYNGQQYPEGEKWTVGCESDCECASGLYGYYRCIARCPIWGPLPQGCKLVNVPNGCCQVPDCSGITAPGGQCRFNNKYYNQGETWTDGCNYNCKCMNAKIGEFWCESRCPVYVSIPPTCQMVTSTDDTCCKVPVCQGYSLAYTPSQISNMQFGSIPYKAVAVVPKRKPGHCMYNGQQYTQGQRWTEGCKYNCDCASGQYGYWRCTARCPIWGPLPRGCKLVNVKGQCCQVPDCRAITEPAGQCRYKNKVYNQGETWTDGCNYNCKCMNAKIGEFWCESRCPQYVNIPSTCSLVKSGCCQVPVCSGYSLAYTHSEVTGMEFGSIEYGQLVPSKKIPVNGCEYKSQLYTQGQTWNDGCDYTCTCLDASQGRYNCKSRCKTYHNLTPGCVLKYKSGDKCCKVPDCSGRKKTPKPKQRMFIIPRLNSVNRHSGYVPPGTKQTRVGAGKTMTKVGETPDTSSPMMKPKMHTGTKPGGFSFKNIKDGQSAGSLRGGMHFKPNTNTLNVNKNLPMIQSIANTMSKINTVGTNVGEFPMTGSMDRGNKGMTYNGGQKTPAYQKPMFISGTHSGGTTGNNPKPSMSHTSPISIETIERPQINTFTTSGTRCMYKGKQYVKGQTWNDGCILKCVCGDYGNFKCGDLCPTYKLPAGCMMKKIAGQCCGEVDCSSSTYRVSNMQLSHMSSKDITKLLSNGGHNVRVTNMDGSVTTLAKLMEGGSAVGQNKLPMTSGTGRGSGGMLHGTQNPVDGRKFTMGGKHTLSNKVGLSDLTRPDDSSVTSAGNAVTGGKGSKPFRFRQGQQVVDGSKFTIGSEFQKAGFTEVGDNTNPGIIMTSGQPYQTQMGDPFTLRDSPNALQRTVNAHGFDGTNKNTLGSKVDISGVSSMNSKFHSSAGGQMMGVCVYKGKQYQQGQKWNDGCEYKCTCTDSSRGYYQCEERCPTYTNIPSNCVLKLPHGEPCCKEMVCPSSTMVGPISMVSGVMAGERSSGMNNMHGGSTSRSGTSGTSGMMVHGGSLAGAHQKGPKMSGMKKPIGCPYKGKVYMQGEQWNDDCKMKCRCDDNVTQKISCRSLCINWSLPKTHCSLQPPAPGKCCPTPKCSGGYAVTYPKGYVAE